ncbi:MAG: hypothetical protein AAFR61_24035 [Bacteroidota bacterium]
MILQSLRSLSLLLILFIAPLAWSQAQNLVDSLQAQLPHLPPLQQIKVKATLSFWLRNEDPEVSLRYGREAVLQGREMNANKELGFALNNLGIFFESQGHLDSARSYFQAALEAYGQAGEKAYQAFILQKLGTFLQKHGLKEEAYSYLQQAQSAYQQLDLPTGEKGSLYMQTADLALALGKAEDALSFLTAAQPIWVTRQDTLRLLTSIRRKGEAYLSLGDLDAAEIQLNLADSLLQSRNFLLPQAAVHLTRASYLEARENPREAQRELAAAEAIYLDKGEYAELVEVYLRMSQLSLDRKRLREALNFTQEAAGNLDSVSVSPATQAMILQRFRDIYLQRRQFEEAQAYLLRYERYTDSLTSLQEMKRQAGLREAFYAEQAERNRLQDLQLLKAMQQPEHPKAASWLVYSLLGLLLSMIGLGVFLHIRYRQRLEVERMIAQQQKMRFSSVVEEEEKAWLGFSQHLHLIVGQHLHQAQNEIANLNGYVNRKKPQGQQAIHRSLSALENARSALQKTASQLTPPDLQEVGLESSIEGLTRAVNSRGKIWLQLFKPDPLPAMSAARQLGIYRLLMEILFKLEQSDLSGSVGLNISPHQQGLRIDLKEMDVTMPLVDTLVTSPEGASWAILQTRIAMLNGKADMLQSPEKGTQLSLSFPG